MDPVKLDEYRNMSKAELTSRLKEIKAKLNKFKAGRSLPGAKVTDGDPNKLSEIETFRSLPAEVVQKQKAALREEYKKKPPVPLCIRHKRHKYIRPNYAAASPPAFSEDGDLHEEALSRVHQLSLEGKEASP